MTKPATAKPATIRPATTDALQILNRRHPATAEDLKLREAFGEQIEVAELIHAARTAAGLSQRELAARLGTSASAICRLEDADYEGHSLAMLRRVGAALGQRVQVRFVPVARRATHA